MSSTAIEDVCTHLEFLGYTIRKDGERWVAAHETKLNVLLREFGGGLLFTVFFRTTEEAKSVQPVLYGIANKLNQNAAVARFYLDSDGDLAIESFYPKAYERSAFSAFVDAWHHDTGLLAVFREEIETYLN